MDFIKAVRQAMFAARTAAERGDLSRWTHYVGVAQSVTQAAWDAGDEDVAVGANTYLHIAEREWERHN